MNRNGFTLVELLAVIVLIAVVTLIGSYGVAAVNQNIKTNLCESKIELIIRSAIRYGEDHQYLLTGECGEKISCISLTVGNLLDFNYISTKDYEVVKGADGKEVKKEVILNDVTNDGPDDEGKYGEIEKFNNENIYIWKETDIVYAALANSNLCRKS